MGTIRLQRRPLELFNVYSDPKYQDIVQNMKEMLTRKMAEIGDEPEH